MQRETVRVSDDRRVPFDAAAYVERSRNGDCFVCRVAGGVSPRREFVVHRDDRHIAFLPNFHVQLGYVLIAPIEHREGVVEEGDILDRYPAANVRRPKVHDESRTLGLDRSELGALLVHAGLGELRKGAFITLLALNGLRISEALNANIDDLSTERGHRTLAMVRKGGKHVTIAAQRLVGTRMTRSSRHTGIGLSRWLEPSGFVAVR